MHVTDDVDAAVDEVTGFFANYHSQRFVDGELVLRMQHAPDDAELDALNAEFADIVARGSIERIDATPAEIADDDHVELERLAFRFDRHGWARLRELIDHLNGRAARVDARRALDSRTSSSGVAAERVDRAARSARRAWRSFFSSAAASASPVSAAVRSAVVREVAEAAPRSPGAGR